MAGHSRPKDGVASLACVPAISILVATSCTGNRDARDKRGHDVESVVQTNWEMIKLAHVGERAT
jgi:hypothetical protein